MFKVAKKPHIYTCKYAISKFIACEKDFAENVNMKCHKNFIVKYHRE